MPVFQFTSASLQIFLDIILVIIGLYLVFFKNYFKEHGKQVALKEHIEELTKKVETVKAEIEFSLKSKLDLVFSEKDAIIEFHSAFTSWLNTILTLSPTLVNKTNYMNVGILFIKARNKQLKCEISASQLDLFRSDVDLNEGKNKAIIACITLFANSEKYFRDAAKIYLNMEYENIEADHKEQLDILRNGMEKINSLFDEFHEKKMELYIDVLKAERVVTERLREIIFESSK